MIRYRAHIYSCCANLTLIDDWSDYPYDEDTLIYLWTEGNFGCDCNRALFWGRVAAGVIDSGLVEEFPCGDSNFVVPFLELEDGTRIPIDSGQRLRRLKGERQ